VKRLHIDCAEQENLKGLKSGSNRTNQLCKHENGASCHSSCTAAFGVRLTAPLQDRDGFSKITLESSSFNTHADNLKSERKKETERQINVPPVQVDILRCYSYIRIDPYGSETYKAAGQKSQLSYRLYPQVCNT
jgi:hypothetical protein